MDSAGNASKEAAAKKKLHRREYLRLFLQKRNTAGEGDCRSCRKQTKEPVLRGFINGGRKR